MKLQSFTKYLRQWFSCEMTYYGKNPISVFQEIFDRTDKILIWGGGLSTW